MWPIFSTKLYFWRAKTAIKEMMVSSLDNSNIYKKSIIKGEQNVLTLEIYSLLMTNHFIPESTEIGTMHNINILN